MTRTQFKATFNLESREAEFLKAYLKFTKMPLDLFVNREVAAAIGNILEQPDNWFHGETLWRQYRLPEQLKPDE